jgi:DNA-binding transcriptional regulator YiaG
VSQAVLAAILNTSLSTVRQWEIGEKRPSGPSVKLLNNTNREIEDHLVVVDGAADVNHAA